MRFNKLCREYFSVALMLMCSASFAEIKKDEAVNLLGDPAVAQCQLWYVQDGSTNYALLMPNMELIGAGLSFATVSGMTNSLNGATETQVNQLQNDARVRLIRALAGVGTAKCALLSSPLESVNSEIRKIADPVRDFIKKDLTELVTKELKTGLSDLATQLKNANEAEREKIINTLITEIPQQKELIDAIKKALEK